MPIIDQGQTLIAGYTNDKTHCVGCDLPVIIFGDHTKIAKYIDFPFAVGADGTKILTTSRLDIDLKYLYYMIRSIKYPYEGYARFFKYLKEAIVPVPPFKVQHKIVEILDSIEEIKCLQADANSISNQIIQSAFLEMFGDPVINPRGWSTEKLEKLCLNIFGGGTPSKSISEYYEGKIPWVTPKDMKQDFILDSIDHISEKAIKESSTKLIPPNSLLMVIRSGILKTKLPVAINVCEVTMNQDMKAFVFDDKLTNSQFMLHFFKIYQRYLLNRVRSVTADNLEFSQIKNIDVILPPIELQQKFADFARFIEEIKCSQKNSTVIVNEMYNQILDKAFKGELVC
ncbi:restriction endonuclease subunit S [Methanosarcina horonobensis]|uniref:restriction endonuclease subunit S n=1 Tax=Methanosarcina horonobensis TaxID=418008 RepID=UPI000A96F101|nr:restriction endonuclease subunit S [Methanosarcina horonobensis]